MCHWVLPDEFTTLTEKPSSRPNTNPNLNPTYSTNSNPKT